MADADTLRELRRVRAAMIAHGASAAAVARIDREIERISRRHEDDQPREAAE